MARKGRELTPAELSIFFSNLELIYHSGLALSEGLDILHIHAQDSIEKAHFAALYQASTEGTSLYEAFKGIGAIPAYALSLIRIGEETGSLESTFGSLAVFYAKRDELAKSIKASLFYPLTMMVMVFLVVVVLLTQAMPVFDQVFAQLGFTMEGPAGFLLDLGNALSTYAFVIAAVIVALIITGAILRVSTEGKRLLNNIFQSNPITGDLSLRLSTQRFALALATLLNSGLEVDQALEYAEPLVDDKRAAERIKAIRADIDRGDSFPDAIERSGIFPAASMSLLAVGFKTGSDAAALDQIGEQITASTERKMEGLVGAIEPVLVGIMCILVGVVLLSVMLPLMGVLTNI